MAQLFPRGDLGLLANDKVLTYCFTEEYLLYMVFYISDEPTMATAPVIEQTFP
jgi:uncharacterized protein YhbP (UPF0306 family)